MTAPTLLQFRGARYRLVTAAKLVMWHGTTTGPNGETLRSILKQGLLPDPKKKAYEDPYAGDDEDGYADGIDADTEESMILDTSLGGAYLTNAVGEALKYAKHAVDVHGGDRVLVAAQIETRDPTVRIDEDFLINYIWEFVTRDFEAQNDETYYLEMFQWLESNTQDWEGIVKAWLAKQFPHVQVSARQMAEVLPHFVTALRSIITHTFFKEHWQAAYSEASSPEGEELLDAMGLSIYDIDEFSERRDAVDAYKSAIKQVSDLLTEVTQPPNNNALHNIRILKPVGYRGSSRILAVVSWNEPRYGDARKTATIHYGQDQTIVDRMVKAIGAAAEWTDARGKVAKLPAVK